MRRLALFLFMTSFLSAQTQPEVDLTAEPHHHQVFANNQVRVFTVDLPPYGETLLHRHRHDYFYINLGDSEVRNTVQGKDPVTVKLSDAQTGFLSGGYVHVVRNLRDQPFRNVDVELLQDDRVRHAPAHWDPAHPEDDRGLDVLHGGTKEILFVKDGVRVSEVDLQPGGMDPSHHHAGPHLLVAVNDFELRSEEKGKSPETLAMKSGESRWLRAGLTHALTNSGHHPAKFITLEFH